MWPMALAPDLFARVNRWRLNVQILEFTGARCKVGPCRVLEIVECANLGARFVVVDVSFEESKLPCILTCICPCLLVSVPIQNPTDSPIKVRIFPHQVRPTPVVDGACVKCPPVVITFDCAYHNSCRRRCALLKKKAVS